MSKDREPCYFDFIHLHEERLNLIYRRWEAQIAKEEAANKSKTLVGRIKSRQKIALGGVAIALGSAFLTCQYSQVNARKTLIASNSQKLELMTWELKDATANSYSRSCVSEDGDIYQLTSGSLNYHALANEPSSFIDRSDTISLVRRSFDTRQPDAYLRLNPHLNLLFGSIEQTGNSSQTTTKVIDLVRPAYLSNNPKAITNQIAVQEDAIALHEELSQCFGGFDRLDNILPFPQVPYAD